MYALKCDLSNKKEKIWRLTRNTSCLLCSPSLFDFNRLSDSFTLSVSVCVSIGCLVSRLIFSLPRSWNKQNVYMEYQFRISFYQISLHSRTPTKWRQRPFIDQRYIKWSRKTSPCHKITSTNTHTRTYIIIIYFHMINTQTMWWENKL